MRSWLVCALGSALAACHYSADYGGTMYQCNDGKCPSGYTCINAQCVAMLEGDSGVPVDSGGDSAARSWWNPAFTKRAQLTITNNATTTLGTGFPVMVNVNIAQLDAPGAVYDALRVVHFNSATNQWTEVTRYNEGGGSTHQMWFSLTAPLASSASTTEFWLYFGNPSPTVAPGSGSAVFDFYDSFSGTTVDATKWAIQGVPTEGGMNLTLKNGDSVHSLVQFAPGYAFATSMTAPTAAPRYWAGFQRQNDFTDADPWMIWVNRATSDSDFPPAGSAATIWGETYSTALGMTTPNWGTAKPLDGAKHWYTVQRHTDRIVYKYDEQVVSTYMLPANDTSMVQVRLANEGAGTIPFGMVHVRKAVWPDPTATIGTTEPY